MKMKPNYGVLALAWVALFSSFVALFFLPDQVPTHWNFSGEIDSYGSKYLYLFMGSLGLLGYYLIGLTKSIDPYGKKIERNMSGYAMMRNIISVMLSMISMISILAVLVKEINMTMMIFVLLGIFLIVIGNYMPRVPHNYFVGVKTPWAITDEMNWKKTQRMGAYGFVICGILLTLAGLLNNKILLALAFSMLFITTIWDYIYSWLLFKKATKAQE